MGQKMSYGTPGEKAISTDEKILAKLEEILEELKTLNEKVVDVV